MDPTMRVETLREIRRILADQETESVSAAYEKAAKPEMRAALQKLNRDYQALSLAGKAAERNVPRYAVNPKLIEDAKVGTLAGLSYDQVVEAARKLPGEARAALLAANHDTQALGVAERAAQETTNAYATNRNLGLSEYMAMGASVASGHALAAPIVGAAHKVARMRGNAFMAASLSRISALKAIAGRADEVDTQIARGLRAFTERAEGAGSSGVREEAAGKRVRLRVYSRPDSDQAAEERYKDAVRKVQAAAQSPVDATPAIETLAPHAPNVANSFSRQVQTAATWLATQVPPVPQWGSKTPSPLDQHEFLVKVDAVDHPVDAILGGLARGDLQRVQVDAVKNGAPDMYVTLKSQIDAKLRKMIAGDQKLPYEMRRDLALLFDEPTDYSMTPEGVNFLQGNLQMPAPDGLPGGSSPQAPKGPQREVKTQAADNAMTPGQRRMGGQIR